MKLKKSFWAKFLPFCFIVLIFSLSCKSIPVPGQNEARIQNIYTEYINIGDSYFKLEDYENAATYYNMALEDTKNYWAAYYKLAKCYVYTSDWNNALPMYKTILKRDPENSSIKAALAYIYLMQGNFKKASEKYIELLGEQPQNKEYLENYLALLLSNPKKIQKNKESFLHYFKIYKESYPESDIINRFQTKFDELEGNPELQASDDSEDLEDSDESENSEETDDSENDETTKNDGTQKKN